VLAEFGRIERCVREAEILATTLDDQRRLGWVWTYMSSYHWTTGGHVTAVQTYAQKVEAIGETLSDVPLQVAAQYYRAGASYISGDHEGAEACCRSMLSFVHGDRHRERFRLPLFPAVLSRALLARTLAERGVFEEGEAHGHEAIRIAEALDHPFSLIYASLGLAYLDGIRGELSQAARLLERALAQCREWNITLLTPPPPWRRWVKCTYGQDASERASHGCSRPWPPMSPRGSDTTTQSASCSSARRICSRTEPRTPARAPTVP